MSRKEIMILTTLALSIVFPILTLLDIYCFKFHSDYLFSYNDIPLTARIYIDNDERLRYSNIDDSSLSLNLGVSIRRNSSVKIYLKISDIFGRTYELMNGVYENGMNYLGEVIIK